MFSTIPGPALLAALLAAGCRPAPSASVVNYETKRPIPNATIFLAGKVIRADGKGEFAFNQPQQSQPLLLRAAGFWPKKCDVPSGKLPRLELDPLETRGLYLSYATLSIPEVRARALQLLDGERLNTLVVDIKDRQGRMTFYNGAPNAGQIGAFGAIKFDDVPSSSKCIRSTSMSWAASPLSMIHCWPSTTRSGRSGRANGPAPIGPIPTAKR
jgi:hypothetical protein